LKFYIGKSFIIQDYGLKKKHIRALGPTLSNKAFDLLMFANTKLTDESLSILISFLKESYCKKLCLMGNSFGKQTIEAFSNSFILPGKKLIELNLNNCKVP